MKRNLTFSLHPDLLSKQLGAAMYQAAEALKQLVANALDADSSRVDVKIELNEFGGPSRLTIRDDGVGITPKGMVETFQTVGVHVPRESSRREAIGSRGIGRFSVFALASESRWQTVAETEEGLIRQRWVMVSGGRGFEIDEETSEKNAEHGTTVDMTLRPRQDVVALFSSEKTVRRRLFNAFAGYIARYDSEVGIWVNDEKLTLAEFVDDHLTEDIEGHDALPEAVLHHMILNNQVEQSAPNLLVFATHGETISEERIEEDPIPGHKYFGLVDSPFLSDLTNTNKSAFAEFEPSFQALRSEAQRRSSKFIQERQADRRRSFLEQARARPYYPFK